MRYVKMKSFQRDLTSFSCCVPDGLVDFVRIYILSYNMRNLTF